MTKIFSVHECDLKPGVSEEEFEKFMVEEMLPVYADTPVKCYIVKGDKGRHNGKIGMVLMTDVETRNRLFGPPGEGPSQEEWTDEGRRVAEKYYTLCDSPFTDFKVILD